MKVIILGSLGMLGQELTRVFGLDNRYEVHSFDAENLDVSNFSLLAETLATFKPDIVLNAVAYNAVDLVEESDEELQKAKMLNGDLPERLAMLSRELKFLLVHFSSDYVFDGALEATKEIQKKKCQGACCGGNCHGTKEGYNENALPNPISKYGETKYAGERAILNAAETFYIIRLSKLFGAPATSAQGKRSFFEVMLEAGKSKPEVSVVDGEMSCFTYAPDLAMATKELVESGDEYGIYHLINEGAVTWYEGVLELYRQAGVLTPVEPVGSDAFPRPAKRPGFSVLINTKRPKLRHYSEAIKDFLASRV